MEIKEALTYDDVLLQPKKAIVTSRSEISTRSLLSKHIALETPIVSANMDTVTEAEMAMTMAREGGIGIIHRFMSIEEQVNQINKVKRSESIIIDKPFSLKQYNTVSDAKQLMALQGISGILVTDVNNKLIGIVSSRDVSFEEDNNLKLSEVMTEKEDLITALYGISLDDAKKLLHEYRIEKLPLIDDAGYIKGLITRRDILKSTLHPLASKDDRGRLRVGAAIGVKTGYIERAEALINAGTDILVLDIAHGHSEAGLRTVKELRVHFGNIEIMAGNIATAEAVEDFAKLEVDSLKVGIGPGTTCTTRIVTGCGVPQLTAIMECAKIAKDYDIPLVADGGIKVSGDITKALAAGASTVMIGGSFAGTQEAPGVTRIINGMKYKVCRGMASFDATQDRLKKTEENKNTCNTKTFDDIVPEGIEALVPFRGNVAELIKQFIGGLKSGISYCGANNIKSMQQNATFIKITTAGMTESRPHDVKMSY